MLWVRNQSANEFDRRLKVGTTKTQRAQQFLPETTSILLYLHNTRQRRHTDDHHGAELEQLAALHDLRDPAHLDHLLAHLVPLALALA